MRNERQTSLYNGGVQINDTLYVIYLNYEITVALHHAERRVIDITLHAMIGWRHGKRVIYSTSVSGPRLAQLRQSLDIDCVQLGPVRRRSRRKCLEWPDPFVCIYQYERRYLGLTAKSRHFKCGVVCNLHNRPPCVFIDMESNTSNKVFPLRSFQSHRCYVILAKLFQYCQ